MYKFVDTTEVSEGALLPSEALKINGEYIENLISGYRTLNVKGREALSPDVSSYTVGNSDGSKLKSRRFPERIITVKYQLIAESNEAFREAYNKLAQILNVEDAELIFNDENDKFFIGTPCIIGEVEPGRNAVIGEFEILCVDPFKYSVIEYEATADLNESSILIDYNGTYKSFPILEADFYKENEASEDGETITALSDNGDCGFVAFFTENEKIVQLGNPDEADGENAYPKAQTLINNTFNKSTSWNAAAKAQWALNKGYSPTTDLLQSGSVGMGVASYATAAKASDTSGTLLKVTSKAELPHVDYSISAKATNRTANSVKVTISITAALARSTNYFGNGYSLDASVYIGGAWRTVTLKKSTDYWRGRTAHTKNITVTISGLSANTTALTGIKFKAVRTDGYGGGSGILGETACSDLKISTYTAATPETYYLKPTGYGSGNGWHGVTITRKTPADKSGEIGCMNFIVSFSHRLSIGNGSKASSEVGTFQCMLWNGEQLVAGVNIYKNTSGKTAYMRFYVNDATVLTTTIDLSYNNSTFNSSKCSTIAKMGELITFNIGGKVFSFRDSDIETPVTDITFSFLQHGPKTPLSYNGLYWVKVTKHSCNTWKDIPNKFSANDIVEADCKNGEIRLNGVLAPDLGALGNDWEAFVLTQGLNQIGFAYSDWLTSDYAPTFKVRYREVFL